ncbi:Restriction endonuclease XhoI [Halovenus aranensis]|uniref:Restriction endonuclease XhoI n=1 Tax=Halovenus aranensis TaxID=890420 RepID=A0A1G8VA64_9EURY|nr:PaeR7I family type II restriction endonuclease [Halovenus aranensis]SDJ62992.1 Restriction endonuclease XhoI [Halovenus aranensis]
MSIDDLEQEISDAVTHYWAKLSDQEEAQKKSENTARGRRAEVVGGEQMDGLAGLIEDALVDAGLPRDAVLHDHDAVLPGYYRATKRWDIAVVVDDELLAVMELKSIASSFGNNLNNRIEEAVGNNTDLYQAYQEGLFEPSPTPWVGYLILMADTEKSRGSVRIREPNFEVDDEFKDASYIDRTEQLCLRMVRQRLVDQAAFLTSPKDGGIEGKYNEVNPELTFSRYLSSLVAHIQSHMDYEQPDIQDYESDSAE